MGLSGRMMERAENECTQQTEKVSEILTSNKHNCFSEIYPKLPPPRAGTQWGRGESSALHQELPELRFGKVSEWMSQLSALARADLSTQVRGAAPYSRVAPGVLVLEAEGWGCWRERSQGHCHLNFHADMGMCRWRISPAFTGWVLCFAGWRMRIQSICPADTELMEERGNNRREVMGATRCAASSGSSSWFLLPGQGPWEFLRLCEYRTSDKLCYFFYLRFSHV